MSANEFARENFRLAKRNPLEVELDGHIAGRPRHVEIVLYQERRIRSRKGYRKTVQMFPRFVYEAIQEFEPERNGPNGWIINIPPHYDRTRAFLRIRQLIVGALKKNGWVRNDVQRSTEREYIASFVHVDEL